MRRPVLLVCLFAAGCSDTLTPYSLITGLRLLGAKAEPAEAAAGQEVALTAFAVDPDGSPITFDWTACLAPPIPGTGTVNSDCLTVDGGPLLVPLGDGAMIKTMVPAAGADVLGDPDATGGRYLPIRLRTGTPATSIDGLFRLRWADGGALNHNPTLDAVAIVTEDGSGKVQSRSPLDAVTPTVVHRGDRLTLRATFSAGSDESYLVPQPDGTARMATEVLSVSWFTTAGSWSSDSTGADTDTTLTLDKNLPASGSTPIQIDLYLVGRDERGGLDFMHRALRME
jgi:hypothetical protein